MSGASPEQTEKAFAKAAEQWGGSFERQNSQKITEKGLATVQNALLKQQDMGSSYAMHMGEVLRDNFSMVSASDDVRAILTIQTSVTNANPANLAYVGSMELGTQLKPTSCEADYKKMGMAQLGIKLMNDLNAMKPEERNQYLREGGAKKVHTTFQRMEAYLEAGKPKYMKKANDVAKKVQNHINIKSFSMLRENQLEKFLTAEQNQLENNVAENQIEEKNVADKAVTGAEPIVPV